MRAIAERWPASRCSSAAGEPVGGRSSPGPTPPAAVNRRPRPTSATTPQTRSKTDSWADLPTSTAGFPAARLRNQGVHAIEFLERNLFRADQAQHQLRSCPVEHPIEVARRAFFPAKEWRVNKSPAFDVMRNELLSFHDAQER